MDPRGLRHIGPYEVVRFVDEGGMAWVFEVVDPRFDARRALKMLKPAAAGGDEFRRFESEARVLAGIDHPNLITIYDFGRDEDTGCFYYTMTFVEGPTLAERGVVSAEEAGPLYLDVLAALAQLHDRGIVHRDVKPGNILLTEDGRALLSDLGIARVEDGAGLTRTGTALGTVLYMAPEQARGKQVTPASDVFSVGLSLYQTLCGRTVYDGVEGLDATSGHDVLLYLGSLLHGGRELELHFGQEVPEALHGLIRRACRFDPAERYADARALHDALYDAIYDEPRRAPAAAPRRGRGAALGIALLLAAVGFGVWRLWPDPERDAASAARAEADRLAARAASVLASAEALAPPAESEVLARARRELDAADAQRARARDAQDARDWAGARRAVQGALTGYASACATLTQEDLASRVDARREVLAARIERLRAAGGPASLSPASWSGLEEGLGELARPPASEAAPCAAAEAQLERLAAVSALEDRSHAAETELGRAWPELARERRRAADEAEQRAAALLEAPPDGLPAEALERASALAAEGRSERAVGDEALGGGDGLAALEAFERARTALDAARFAIEAARDRAESRRLRDAADLFGLDLAFAERLESSAAAHAEAGRWEQAAADYGLLVHVVTGLLADTAGSHGALQAAQRAAEARAATVASGAPESALADADAGYEEALVALGAREYSASEARFREVTSTYGALRRTSRAGDRP